MRGPLSRVSRLAEPRIVAALLGLAVVAGSLGLDRASLIAVALLAGAGVALAARGSPLPGLVLTALAAGYSGLRGGSWLSGACVLAAGLYVAAGLEVPGSWMAWRVLAPAGLASAYPVLFALLAGHSARSGTGPALLGLAEGRGLLVALLSMLSAFTLWSSMAPGRGFPGTRGFVSAARRRIELLVLAPVLGVAAAAVIVSPVSLVIILVASASYVWARMLGADRLVGILVFSVVLVGLLYLAGIGQALDHSLAR